MITTIEGEAVAAGLPPPLVLSPSDASQLAFALQRDRVGNAAVQLVSSRSSEGTSTVARDVCLVSAFNGAATLLLAAEAPVRRPDWARSIYGMPGGLGSVSNAPAELTMVRVGVTGLALAAPAGTAPLPLPAWAAVLAQLRQRFEFIVIDTPPLERAFTCVVLAPMLDATAIVVAAESTRASAVRRLRDRLGEVGGQTVGVVLNKRRFHVPRAAYERL